MTKRDVIKHMYRAIGQGALFPFFFFVGKEKSVKQVAVAEDK